MPSFWLITSLKTPCLHRAALRGPGKEDGNVCFLRRHSSTRNQVRHRWGQIWSGSPRDKLFKLLDSWNNYFHLISWKMGIMLQSLCRMPTSMLWNKEWEDAPKGPGTWTTPFIAGVQSLSRVRLFATLWTAAHQAFQAFTFSWSLPKCMSVESVMPSNHLILRRPLLLLPSVFPSTRVSSKLWETVRREAWRAAVHGVAKSRTRLSDWTPPPRG